MIQIQIQRKDLKKPNKKTSVPIQIVKNVRNKPWNLRDGDIIVIKNKLEDPENKDNFILNKIATFQQHTNKPNKGIKSQRTRAPEAILSINLDADM